MPTRGDVVTPKPSMERPPAGATASAATAAAAATADSPLTKSGGAYTAAAPSWISGARPLLASVARVAEADAALGDRHALVVDPRVRPLDQVEEELVQLLRRRPLVGEPAGGQDSPRFLLPRPAALESIQEPQIDVVLPHAGGYRRPRLTRSSPIRGYSQAQRKPRSAPLDTSLSAGRGAPAEREAPHLAPADERPPAPAVALGLEHVDDPAQQPAVAQLATAHLEPERDRPEPRLAARASDVLAHAGERRQPAARPGHVPVAVEARHALAPSVGQLRVDRCSAAREGSKGGGRRRSESSSVAIGATHPPAPADALHSARRSGILAGGRPVFSFPPAAPIRAVAG